MTSQDANKILLTYDSRGVEQKKIALEFLCADATLTAFEEVYRYYTEKLTYNNDKSVEADINHWRTKVLFYRNFRDNPKPN